jgi:hypothetical protein
MIASNKQRQGQNKLATIQKANLKRAHELSKNLYFVQPRIQIENLTRMEMVVIEDYYHMTLMGEIMNWIKITHLFSFIYLRFIFLEA